MSFRRRDPGRATYSYADAYRTLSNPATQSNSGSLTNPPSAPSSTGHGHTSEDEGGIVFSTGSNARAVVPGSDSSAPGSPNPQSQASEPSATPAAAQDSASRGSRPTRGRETERNARPPPSAFAFPFQSHPGNPDPGMSIPGVARRASVDSFKTRPKSSGSISNANPTSIYQVASGYQSHGDLAGEALGRPNAPFMAGGEGRDGSPIPPPSPNLSQSNLYRNSVAGALNGDQYALPRTSSVPTITMRAPFLSPASRPSSLWSPPAYPYPPGFSGSLPYLPTSASPAPPYTKKSKSLMPSTRLEEKLTKEDKPWLREKDKRARWSWWLTLLCFFIGIGGAGVVLYFGWTNVKFLKDSDMCLVLNDGFDSLDLDNTWTRDVELGGFGNGEFQMTTDSSDNLYTQNGQLYIVPTLTSDEIGRDGIKDGSNYTLSGCTSNNGSACSVSSSSSQGTVINPVKSARLSTQGHFDIKFGKVEVRAKNPKGDWLWPAIWMLPTDDSVYGPWPIGGEIDIMEARGNGPSYPAQGSNFVRSSLNYGVLPALQTHMFGWWQSKRSSFSDDFHVYAVEWTPDWMRFYVDNRLQAMMTVKITGKGGKSFFDRGKYPPTAHNGSDTQVVVEDVWAQKGGSAAAPFDQSFYLILDLAAGGTSGWFPDKVGGKPWFDASGTAMRDFADAQDTWAATWPSDVNERAFRIDYVKMWKLGRC